MCIIETKNISGVEFKFHMWNGERGVLVSRGSSSSQVAEKTLQEE